MLPWRPMMDQCVFLLDKNVNRAFFRRCIAATVVAVLMTAASIADTEISNDYYIAKMVEAELADGLRDAIVQCRSGKLKQAIPVLQKFSQSGNPDANYILAKIYAEGSVAGKSVNESEKILRENVAAGHLPSMVALGDLVKEQSPVETLQLYKVAQSKGDVVAAIRLGDVYSKGGLPNTRVNPRLAVRFFEAAAEQKSGYAMYRLGNFYAEGKGVSPNELEAGRLFRESALAGFPAANTKMAERYLNGVGVQADPVAAIGWLTRGAQGGDTEAMVRLGQIYQEGKLIKEDLNVAGQLYSTAAKAGDPVGKYQLATLYYYGLGAQPDAVRAYVLLNSAQGFPAAQKMFLRIQKELTPEQLRFANEKIAQAAKQSK